MSTAEIFQEQGIKLYNQYEYEEAGRAFRQAQEAYEAAGQPNMAAEMKVNIGLVHRALNENHQALAMMQEALHTFQDQTDELRMAQVLGNMGGVYTKLNDKEQAYSTYRQAADIFLDLGEKQMYSETLLAMGSLQIRDGKVFVGAATYQIGLAELENLTARQKILKQISSFISAFGRR